VVDYADSISGGGHSMTIVGYNDNAWCDINGNAVVDAGELGAFKVCNQWGKSWQRNGFAYVSYDSIQSVSSIPGANNTDRLRSFRDNEAKWIQAGPVGYKPALLAECSLTTADRASTTYQLGFSDQPVPPAQVALNPWGFGESGHLSFSGTSTPSTATCVFDLTDIADGGRLRFWQLALTQGANSATLNNLVLTDGAGQPLASLRGTLPAGGLPQATTIGTTLSAWVDGCMPAILPRIHWSQPAFAAGENGGNALITLKRSDNPLGVVTVNYATAPGSALAPADFAAQSGTVTWADGDLADKTIAIPVVTDALAEGSEQFTVTLSGVTGATLREAASATVNLCDSGVRDELFNWNNMGSSNVTRLLVQPDGNVLLTGTFQWLQDWGYAVRYHGGISRITPTGQPDPSFRPGSGANSQVNALARQPDGKILIGGGFSSYNGTARKYLARLNADGSLDPSFDPGAGPSSLVNDILVQPDGKILIGGWFTSYQGATAKGLARLNADGSLDPTFSNGAFSGSLMAYKLALQPDGKILVAGAISCTGAGGVGSKCGLARFNANGTRDASFDVGYGATTSSTTGSAFVMECSLQADGKILVGGGFKYFGGQLHSGVARINPNGSVDASFTPVVDSTVSALLLQPDGKILIGGSFAQVNYSAASRIARLNADGSLDTAFLLPGGVDKPLTDFALQPDGNILFSCSSPANYQAASHPESIWRLVGGFPGVSGTLQVSTPVVSVAKGTSVNLTVTRTGGSLGALKVGYAAVPGSATAADFTPTSGFLSWADGDGAPKTISVPTSVSGPAASGATFTVNLAAPINASVILGAQQQAVVTLTASFASWQAKTFTATERANPEISDPTADPDGDGLGNLLEYAFGFEPKTANSTAQPVVGTVNLDGAEYLTLAYRRLVPVSPDLTYTPQATGNLAGVWDATPVLLSGPVANGDGTETLTYRDATALTGATKRFLRLKVTQQP
jgi:uncharacterized delta-60 repeat protein